MNIFFVSLGCDKNLVDSEYMLGMMPDIPLLMMKRRQM